MGHRHNSKKFFRGKSPAGRSAIAIARSQRRLWDGRWSLARRGGRSNARPQDVAALLIGDHGGVGRVDRRGRTPRKMASLLRLSRSQAIFASLEGPAYSRYCPSKRRFSANARTLAL
jgi:hypothetical protein